MLKLTRPPPGAASLACRLLSSGQQVVTGNADQVHRYFAHSEYLMNDGGLRGAIEDWIAWDNRTARYIRIARDADVAQRSFDARTE